MTANAGAPALLAYLAPLSLILVAIVAHYVLASRPRVLVRWAWRAAVFSFGVAVAATGTVLVWGALVSPLIGVGSDRFPELSDDFGAGLKIQAHNTIVKVFAESGFFGGICYLGIIFTTFSHLWRNWRRFSKIKPDGPELFYAEALGISLMGFFFNTQFSVKAHEWFLYFVVASTTSLDHLYQREMLIYALKVEKAAALIAGSGTPDAKSA